MNRELILLSPYRLPTHHTLMLNAEDVAVLFNGYLALWHPAVIPGALTPPRFASPYDHEQPSAGHVYAVPESPPLFLPDDWEQRCADAGAVFFRATQDRYETLANLLRALNVEVGDPAWAAPFFGIGFGYGILDALFEAMDHLNQLAVSDFWQEVTRAAETGDSDARHQDLKAAAQRLREARDVLYPNEILLVDLVLLEDRALDAPLPAALAAGVPTNLIISGERLERLNEMNPEVMKLLRARVHAGQAEICGGCYREREDALLPLESQLWNLRRGAEAYRTLLGQDLHVFARKRFGASPQLPQLLNAVGLNRALILAFDEGVLPQFHAAITEWSLPDGKRIAAFTKAPLPADSALTYFHLAYHLSRTLMQDATASLAFQHSDKPDASFHQDWLELDRLVPVFGQWATLTRFFEEVAAGDYPSPPTADQFHSDYLQERVDQHREQPVSHFAQSARSRRRLDTAWTMAGLYRGLVRPDADAPLWQELPQLEVAAELDRLESTGELDAVKQKTAEALTGRLLARAGKEMPGWMLLNPCSFARRVGVDLAGIRTPLPAPARATQIEGDRARVVVEIPALGFAWVPTAVAPGTLVSIPRKKQLVEDRKLFNDYFEAEIDAQTGGLRTFRDLRSRSNRLGQQLVYGPGSTMRVKEIKTHSSGPAMGELTTEGALVDAHEAILATFRQRFRVWWHRPLLEMRIEIFPTEAPTGYPWHAYYGARFAWPGIKMPLFRAVNMQNALTSHHRPESPDFLELRDGPERTLILTGGLPFHQRHGQRMLDVVLLPQGESSRVFDLALGLNLDEPMQWAMDYLTPPVVVPTTTGPPHVGTSGWLFHLDAENVLITNLCPDLDNADAVLARLVECRGIATPAVLRCPRNPVQVQVIDEKGQPLEGLAVTDDAIALDFTAGEMKRLRIAFS
jgi:alpha-mannosidase